ncbi:LuxR family transcriptional regulator [Kutzneria viridogrisea]|uniref:DNA-binding CsgD family transcriptional regulator n=1 Tax=Kutzneria viridogrisea TaxID=47990 RepID=A0ABR6BLL2_9PSEU|nr:DNA-binding CsgD family transcriptional regulator [Kutzneria viridogrisea]
MRLVARNNELTDLQRLFAECARRKGRIALISGGLASGKTELVQQFLDHAEHRGALVLSATCSLAESTLQMGVMGQLFHSAELPEAIYDRVSGLLGFDEPPPRTGTDPVAVRQSEVEAAHQMCRALVELSRDRTLVLAVDDMQFADRASLQVLLYLQRRMQSAAVLVVLTEWDRPQLTPAHFRAEITRRPHHRITLGPLAQGEVAELIGERLDAELATHLAPQYHRLTGGNPLLLHALVADQAADEQLTCTPGDAFAQAVLACLHRGDPLLFDVASGWAVLAEHASPALVARLVGESADVVSHTADTLVRAGLLTESGFRHPAVRSAVLDGIGSALRTALHSRAAELVHQHGSSAVEVATHLIAADDAPAEWAIEVLRDAAEQWLAEDRVELATSSLELALRCCTDPRRGTAIAAALVQAQWRVNPSGAALHMSPLLTALHEGELPAREAAIAVRHLLWQGDVRGASQAIATLSAATTADTEVGAELRLAYQWVHGAPPSFVPQHKRPRAGDGPDYATGNLWARAAAVLSGGAEDTAAVEHILQSCRLGDTTLEVVASALLALVHADHADKAAAWCDSLLHEAVQRKAVTWQAVLGGIRADIAYQLGDLPTARSQAEQAFGLLNTQSWGVLIGLPLSTLLLTYTAMGRFELAADLTRHITPEAMLDTVFGHRYLHARGHYHLATNRAFAAVSDFQNCANLMSKNPRLDLPGAVPWRSDLAQAFLLLQRPKEARKLVTQQLATSAPNARTRGISLRVLAASSDLKQRPPLLREAIDLLQGCGDRLELAHALADLGQVHQELGEFGRAQMMAHRAAQEAEACKAVPLQERVALHRSTEFSKQIELWQEVESAATRSLSDAERRVAGLAALGYTNREIGHRLHITVSTVEQHLTRVYRKLKVNNRAALVSSVPLCSAAAMPGSA